MTKQSVYLANAAECRALAATMTSRTERRQTLLIAEQWERMAAEADAAERDRPAGGKTERDS